MPMLTEPAWAVVSLALIIAVRDVALAWIASRSINVPAPATIVKR